MSSKKRQMLARARLNEQVLALLLMTLPDDDMQTNNTQCSPRSNIPNAVRQSQTVKDVENMCHSEYMYPNAVSVFMPLIIYAGRVWW